MHLSHSISLPRFGRAAGVLASAALAAGVLAGPAAAAPVGVTTSGGGYTFQTITSSQDPTFTQLLGIKNNDTIAGYYGSGAAGHPNKGFTVVPPYGSAQYHPENYPGSVQTQVTGLNNNGTNVGFWADANGDNFGFSFHNGTYTNVPFPAAANANPAVDQLLGVNDSNVAVGFYVNSKGATTGVTYNIATKKFTNVGISGDHNVIAAGINGLGDIAGVGTTAGGVTEGFLRIAAGKTIHLQYPGADATQALGVNDGDVVVGFYAVGGDTHGFVWAPGYGYQTVDDSAGVGTTTINGINDRGSIVGFYTDAAGNVDGMLGTPIAP